MKSIIKLSYLCLFFVLTNVARGQTENEDVKFNVVLRHIKGVQGVDAVCGATGLGRCLEVNYNKFISPKVFIMPGLNFEAAGVGLSVFKDYTAHLGFGWTVFQVGQRFYINIPFGAYIGVEAIKPYQDASIDFTYAGANKFICGGFAGINPEFFILKHLALIVTVKEIYIWNCPFGNFKYEVMGGLRFIIN
ncbi:MAG TPA: conjugal transfer protein TraO [Bacteroidia bacterium]